MEPFPVVNDNKIFGFSTAAGEAVANPPAQAWTTVGGYGENVLTDVTDNLWAPQKVGKATGVGQSMFAS